MSSFEHRCSICTDPLYFSSLETPLRVLTLKGEGMQVISQLVILEDLLSKVTGGPGQKLKPCQYFDVICGIGSGGWLAILLGKVHMDIKACLREWSTLAPALFCPKKMVDHDKFRAEVNHLARRPDIMSALRDTSRLLTDGICPCNHHRHRARHVFVAASSLESSSKHYVFRSYPTLEREDVVLPGASARLDFTTGDAFFATGSTEYFTAPCGVFIAVFQMVILQNKFPNTTNINQIAADEIWALYGAGNVKGSVFVNIGPGPPCSKDIRKIVGLVPWLFTPKKPTPDYGVYPEGFIRQFRMVPKQASAGSVRNDTLVSDTVKKATKRYLAAEDVALLVEQCARAIISTDATDSNGSSSVAATVPSPPGTLAMDFVNDPPPRYWP